MPWLNAEYVVKPPRKPVATSATTSGAGERRAQNAPRNPAARQPSTFTTRIGHGNAPPTRPPIHSASRKRAPLPIAPPRQTHASRAIE